MVNERGRCETVWAVCREQDCVVESERLSKKDKRSSFLSGASIRNKKSADDVYCERYKYE